MIQTHYNLIAGSEGLYLILKLRRVWSQIHQLVSSKKPVQVTSANHSATQWRQQGFTGTEQEIKAIAASVKEVLLFRGVQKGIFIPKILDWSLEMRCVLLLCLFSRSGSLRVNSDHDVQVHSWNNLIGHIPPLFLTRF